MEHPVMSISLCFSPSIQAILLLFLSTLVLNFANAFTLTNETDKLALLDFKSHITRDPPSLLASWNESFHFCQWFGVTCSLSHQRVTSLDLNDQWLAGTISPHIGNLSFLQSLSLANNSFHGEIPPEVGRLIRLQNLNLSYNSLEGGIPVNLSHCSNLMNLDLQDNNLEQQIPYELGSLSKLVILHINDNNLTGKLPASIGNLTSLQELSLRFNNLEGEIPDTIAHMRSMTRFLVGPNNLSGVFPPSLYNLSSLEAISLAANNFFGNLRPNMGLSLPNLRGFTIGANQFTGTIPVSLSNASNLHILDIGNNNFTGNVPLTFGNLYKLKWLGVGHNLLGSYGTDDFNFLSSLTNCSQLDWLDFGYNHFGGELPTSIGNLSTQMTWLTMGGNRIGGSVPEGIANLVNLTNLCMQSNLFTGNIPAWIGKLPQLTGLSLEENKLTGQIPSSISNLTQLSELDLHDNSLEGNIPPSLANCQHLRILDLSYNKLNGTIPNQLVGLSSLSVLLNISYNSLSGSLPLEVGKLIFLVALDVSNNKLSGEIPSTLGSCVALEQLYVQRNFFQGTIPKLTELKGLKWLDLSCNNLSGRIPNYLAGFSSLQNLNLSFNNLDGEVPKEGIFKNSSAIEVFGNSKLCGGIQQLQLHACPVQGSQKHRRHISLKLVLVIVSLASCLVLILVPISLCWRQKLKKPLVAPSFGPFYPKVSYEELLRATSGFSLENLIGSGNFGTVYKGILGPDEATVAVKLLNLQKQGASKSFMAECQALRNIRHRNLVKVLTACSSADSKGNEVKALVFEFMPKGSLESWLHPEDGWKQWRHLSLLQRINIAIDVASALNYLHHQCQTPVIHCDLKPSNVLLDNDLTAHVSDFGLARLLLKPSKDNHSNQFSSLGIKGTIGYAAPEYGMGGKVSSLGDVYSYGILLLEMFTGRRPTDDLFKDNLNLHKFVKMALPGRVIEIVDQSILYEQLEMENSIDSFSCQRKKQTECLLSIFEVGVACSTESPGHRMNMSNVASELLSIRDKYLGTGLYEETIQDLVNRSI